MHPIHPSRLAYGLGSTCESSFPERHAWSEPEDISHLENQDDVTYSQPGFPKLDVFAQGLPSFWQENWLDQSQTPLLHRQHHSHHDNLTSPVAHQSNHAFFSPSPISPIQHPAEPSPQAEWVILRSSNRPQHQPLPLQIQTQHLPWLPSQDPSTTDSSTKPDSDSESAYSLPDRDSLEDPVIIQPTITRFRRRGSTGRVSKVSRLSTKAATAGQGAIGAVYHTFRVGNRNRNTNPKPVTVSSPHDIPSINHLDGAGLYGIGNGVEEDDHAAKVEERRIAHKLSEKSRRNRLTAAIRDMHGLMGKEEKNKARKGVGDGEEDGDEEGLAVQSHFSKVDVAELAVVWMRRLKTENERLRRRVGEVEKKQKEEAEGEEQEKVGEKGCEDGGEGEGKDGDCERRKET